MQAVTFPQQLTRWAEANAEALRALGEVTVRSSDGQRNKLSAHVALEAPSGSVEIIVWDSGECEFAYGTAERPLHEHHEVMTTDHLDRLLDRFLDRAKEFQIYS